MCTTYRLVLAAMVGDASAQAGGGATVAERDGAMSARRLQTGSMDATESDRDPPRIAKMQG